jgi:hypothetical protein
MIMHTKNYNSHLLNIDELIITLQKRRSKLINILDIDRKTLDLRAQSGFSEERLIKCDISIPIIIDGEYGVLDGRHRIFKAFLFNKRHILIKLATNNDIMNCIVKPV